MQYWKIFDQINIQDTNKILNNSKIMRDNTTLSCADIN